MKRQSVLVLVVIALLILLVDTQSVVVLTTFDDGGVHNINYTISGNVKVDYQAPYVVTTVNLLDGGVIEGWLQTYGLIVNR